MHLRIKIEIFLQQWHRPSIPYLKHISSVNVKADFFTSFHRSAAGYNVRSVSPENRSLSKVDRRARLQRNIRQGVERPAALRTLHAEHSNIQAKTENISVSQILRIRPAVSLWFYLGPRLLSDIIVGLLLLLLLLLLFYLLGLCLSSVTSLFLCISELDISTACMLVCLNVCLSVWLFVSLSLCLSFCLLCYVALIGE